GPTKAIKSAVISQPYTIGFGGRTDFLFAGDCADAFIAAAERGPDGASVYNLAGAAVEVTAFASELISQVPAAADLIRVEGGELPVPGAIAGARLDDALPGLSRTSLTDGIADTLQRFRALHAAGTLSTSDLSS
ncbi:MAG: nucleoside-diphosphate-sugar epimerase, partial [Planctomycetota bacterium]